MPEEEQVLVSDVMKMTAEELRRRGCARPISWWEACADFRRAIQLKDPENITTKCLEKLKYAYYMWP
jgi:hypothetical protein